MGIDIDAMVLLTGFDPYWWEGSIPANILIEVGKIVRYACLKLRPQNLCTDIIMGSAGYRIFQSCSIRSPLFAHIK